LKGRQSLLAIDDRSLLHLTGLLLNLLQHHRAKKMGMMSVKWSSQNPLGNTHYVSIGFQNDPQSACNFDPHQPWI